MLVVRELSFAYGTVEVLHDTSLEVQDGEAVCVIGPNGAGKSTLAYNLAGIYRPLRGYIGFLGRDVTPLPPHRRAALGITLVPEGRRLFSNQTVEQNLLLGAYLVGSRRELARRLDYVYGLFPRLRERSRQIAATLSGGEQQMLAIGRALMAAPKLLILDEPSTGLSPLLIGQLAEALTELKRRGLGLVLVEQNVELALGVAERGYVLENGYIVLSGPSHRLRDDPLVRSIYLGVASSSTGDDGEAGPSAPENRSGRRPPGWLAQ